MPLHPSPPAPPTHGAPAPSPRAHGRTRAAAAPAAAAAAAAHGAPFKSSGSVEWPPRVLLMHASASASSSIGGVGRSGLPLRSSLIPSRGPSPMTGMGGLLERSDSPTHAAAMSMLSVPRMSAAEMLAQNAMASPIIKQQQPTQAPHLLQLHPSDSSSHSSAVNGAAQSSPPQRSSSGTLIPPPSPMLAHGEWIYSLGASASPEASPLDPHAQRDTAMRTLELGPAHTPIQASPIQVTLSGWPTTQQQTDGNPEPQAAATATAAAPPVMSSPLARGNPMSLHVHTRGLGSEFGGAAAAGGGASPSSPIVDEHPSVAFFLSLVLSEEVPPAAIVLLRDQSGCLAATSNSSVDDDANLLLYLSLLHLQGRHFAEFELLAHEVRRAHADSFRQKQRLAAFLTANKEALGLGQLLAQAADQTDTSSKDAGASLVSPRDLHALYAHSCAGPFCIRLLEAEIRRRALSASRGFICADVSSWDELVESTRQSMNRWGAMRRRETDMVRAVLADLRGGGTSLLLPASPLSPASVGTTALSKADAFQLLETVALHPSTIDASSEQFATPMAGLLLLSLLRELVSEDAAFENISELQQALLFMLARKSNDDACQALRSQLAAAAAAAAVSSSLPEDAPSDVAPSAAEFDAWLVSMHRQGLSPPFLAALANLTQWLPHDAGSMPGASTPSPLQLFESYCLDASTRYESSAETAAICLVQQFLATCAPRPLLAPTASAASMLLGSQRAAPLLLYLECVSILHGQDSSAVALYPDVAALQREVDAMRGRHQAELHSVVQSLTAMGLPASESQATLAALLPRFASSIRCALVSAPSDPPAPTPLRLFLSQLQQQRKDFAPLSRSAAETAASAFLLEWRETQSVLHSLLMSLPIPSLSSQLTPPPLLHSQMLVREWQVEQLQCESASGVACLRTLLHMQHDAAAAASASASGSPRQVAGDWAGFMGMFRAARQHVLSAGPDPSEAQHLTVPQQLLHAFLSSPQSRLLSPTVARGGSAEEVELLTRIQPPATGSPRLRQSSSSPLPYACAFHFLLQLQSLEFDRAHLCDTWAQLHEMIQSARTESAHNESDMLAHLAAPDCLLFAPPTNHTDAASDSSATPSAAPSDATSASSSSLPPFQPSLANLSRFSQYVGGGLMKLSVFRALGLEQGSMCARDPDTSTAARRRPPYERFVDFLRRSRAIVATPETTAASASATAQGQTEAPAPPVAPQ